MNIPSLQDLFSLHGEVALVTGAGGGIGQALAQGLAVAGAAVALNGRSEDKLRAVQQAIHDRGGTAEVFPIDLSTLEGVSALDAAIIERFGRVDILVNCAAINRRQPIVEVTPEVYDQIMATNLRSVYFLSQAIARHMIAQGGGKIIHIGSLNAAVGLATVSVYGLTKGAMAQMTKTMAVEWAEHNIQVNCLCPGFIATELTVPLWEDRQRRRWILERVPLKRPGLPEDLVGMAIFLASHASDFMTGQSVYIDGGFTAGSQW